MSTMVSLQRIKLNDNRIVKLPTWIGALTRLKHLALANNKLQYVPYDITKCPLKVLIPPHLQEKCCQWFGARGTGHITVFVF